MHLGFRIRAITLATTGVFLAACGGGTNTPTANLASSDKQIYNVNITTEVSSYDPGQQTYSYEAAVGRTTFEALLKPKADLSDVQPAAASSYSVSSDGLTYTFHLRQNAKWSDGKSVTAADWVYGWQRVLNPALAAGYADPFFDGTVAGGQNYSTVDATNTSAVDSYLQGLGLSAPDPNTFVIKLQHPAPFFKWVATLWVATPIRKDVVEQAAGGSLASTDATKAEAWAQNANTIISNGAFKISEIVPKDHVTMVPNPGYWGGAPKIQKLTYYYVTDANTVYSEYQTGALDTINVPNADVTLVQNDPVLSKQAHLVDQLTTFWVAYNTKRAPLDNPDVRMALAKSVDRNSFVSKILKGVGKPISSFFPSGMNGFDTSDNAQSYDPAAAKALLQKAGVAPADLNKLKLLTRNSTGNITENTFIADQWNTNLGTNIQLDVIDSKTVTRNIRKGQFDIYGPDGWGADYPDQQDWADIFVTGSCHSLNWGCPTLNGYDALVQKADTELSQSARNTEYLQVQKMLIDQAAVGFLFQADYYYLIKPYVGNLTITKFDDEYNPGDQNYATAYITQH